MALADAVAAASGLVMTKTARVPAALVRGLDRAIGDAPPGAARDLVRAPADDLFRESVAVALAAAGPSSVFGSADVPRALLEDAMAVASASPARRGVLVRRGGLDRCAAPAARRRGGPRRCPPDGSRPDRSLCGRRSAASEQATLLTAGAAIRSLLVTLHAQGLAWSWDAGRVLDPDRVRAALALAPDRRPIGVVAVGPMPEGGA